MDEQVKLLQLQAFQLLSDFLNDSPDRINAKLVRELETALGGCGDETHVFTLPLAAACGIDTSGSANDRRLFYDFFEPAVRKLDVAQYNSNPYYKNIQFSVAKTGQWELRYDVYKPFEAFVCDDIVVMPDGRQIPQIGFFDESFRYPAVLENGRIWMTVTPNEVETMRIPIAQAFGKVLTYGLGLGYYAYMVSLKSEVESVTIVEKDASVIELFKTYILPQISESQKIMVEQADAFEYAANRMPEEGFDYVFADLWHDVSDGLPMYQRMKKFETLCPTTKFAYWIEKSMKCYL